MAGGFGHHPFGKAPFGKGSFADVALVRNFPPEYYGLPNDKENDPAYHYLMVAKNSLDNRFAEIDDMGTFMSPMEMPSGLIPYLADSIAVGVNEYEPESYQRSIVENAVRYYKLKGTNNAFTIRGLMSGFEIDVLKMWLVTPDIAAMIPPERLKTVGDKVYSEWGPQEVSGVSGDIPFWGDCTFCLTAYIGIIATLRREAPKGYSVYVLDRMLDSVRTIMPAHVRELFLESKLVFKDIDMSIQAVNQGGEETTYRNVGFNYYFDLWPADVVETDEGVNIMGYTEEG